MIFLRILREWREETIGRPEHMLVGGPNPTRRIAIDTLQFRYSVEAPWQDVPIVEQK